MAEADSCLNHLNFLDVLMPHVLISFLGRGPYRPDGGRGDYRATRYSFCAPGDAEPWLSPPSKHFAHAAFRFRQWQRPEAPFERVVILGTSGSMWDALADSFGADSNEELSETVWRLSEAVDSASVDQGLLQQYGCELSAAGQAAIRLLLIPSATDATSQAEILSQIGAHVEPGDCVWLDVTHGFRHLPMIGLAAATLISTQQSASIEEIAYGALDMSRDGVTPVVSLKWILNLLRAIGGMTEMVSRQNLRPLIDCFPEGALRNALDDIAYKLDVMRIDEAATGARDCIRMLDASIDQLPIELRLLAGVLRDRLVRYSNQSRNIKGLTQMARLALEQDDFLRSSIYLAEAVQLAIDQELPGDNREDEKLKAVRNWLAHAGELKKRRVDRQVRQWVASRGQLRKFLRHQIDRLWREVKETEL